MERKKVTHLPGPLTFDEKKDVELSALYGPVGASVVFREGRKVGGIPIGDMDERFWRAFLVLQLKKPERDTKLSKPFRMRPWNVIRGLSDYQMFHKWMLMYGMPVTKYDWRAMNIARMYQVMDLGAQGPVRTDGTMNFVFAHSPNYGTVETVFWNVRDGMWRIHVAPAHGYLMTRGARLFSGIPYGTKPPQPTDEDSEPLAF